MGLADPVDGASVGFESRPDAAAFARTYPGATGARVTEVWRELLEKAEELGVTPPQAGAAG
ncbi:MAG: hypothetical protein QOF84_4640 [Streptomyces sp.]|jgi:hypothetical protein|nr:hypothetical protein [Streptomyces sp.]MDX6349850.1 hypothetical protein [Streptomyces sp.]